MEAGRPPREGGPASADRAQTTTDFAIGAGVFLLAVGFTFAFVPGMFDPFLGGAGQDRAIVADRVASELSSNLLGSPEDPYSLDAACTAQFFRQVNGNGNATDSCRFDARSGQDSIGAAVDIDELEHVNVTLRGDEDDDGENSFVCRSNSDTIVGCGNADAEAPTTAGPAPPNRAAVVSAQRFVTVSDGDGIEEYRLTVKVW